MAARKNVDTIENIKNLLGKMSGQIEELTRDGDLEEAASFLENALSLHPGNPALMRQLAAVRRGQGKTEEAIHIAQNILKGRPSDTDTLELLIQLYLESGRYNDVVTSGKDLIRNSPRNMFARDLMGVAYLQMGMLDKALQVTNELVHLDPLDASNHFKRAVLYQQKGDIPKAISEFARVLELDPDGDMADEAKDAITWLDSFQLRQIIGLALEDTLFRARLNRDAEQAVADKGFFLSQGGVVTLRQIDFDHLGELAGDWGDQQPTYH